MTFAYEPIAGTRLGWLRFQRQEDHRGWLAEIFNQKDAARLGLEAFGQDNLSFSPRAGTLRGLHYQRPPFAQAKLLRVVRGRIFTVAVDLHVEAARPSWMVMDAGEDRWLHLPQGFAHGFQTLSDGVEAAWKVSAPFRPDHAGAVAFDDPALAIPWPLPVAPADLSLRDREAGALAAARAAFAAPP